MYEFSQKSNKLREQLLAFMDENIYPNEEEYARQLNSAENRFATVPLMEELKQKARADGLWNLFVPESHQEYCDHGGLSFFGCRLDAQIHSTGNWGYARYCAAHDVHGERQF